MRSMPTRRRLMVSAAGAGLLAALVPPCDRRAAIAVAAADTKVRMTTGLVAATHSIAWIGAVAGIFRKYGLDVTFPSLEVGGPESVAGLARGDWEFTQTGTVPVAENVLKGGDAVVLLRNTDKHVGTFVMTRREIKSLRRLDGKKVGVLTDAYSGQTGVNTRRTVEQAGAKATYVGLGTFGNVYDALARGEIDAGPLPVHLRFLGERQHGWHAFPTAALGVPSVFATTRKLVATGRDMVVLAVKGCVETIHLFKTQPDVVVPILQRFLKLDDVRATEDLRAFYAPLLPEVPRPELAAGMQDLRDLFAERYPAAANLKESDIADPSIIDEVEQSGFIRALYAGDAKR